MSAKIANEMKSKNSNKDKTRLEKDLKAAKDEYT
jgi:hypothetical protein